MNGADQCGACNVKAGDSTNSIGDAYDCLNRMRVFRLGVIPCTDTDTTHIPARTHTELLDDTRSSYTEVHTVTRTFPNTGFVNYLYVFVVTEKEEAFIGPTD